MTCPYCGSPTWISRTYEHQTPPSRIRTCTKCGHSFTTYEVRADVANRQVLQAQLNDILTRDSRATARALVVAHQGGGA